MKKNKISVNGVSTSSKYLFPEERKKRGNNPCKFCKENIENAQKYVSVRYNDGFIKRGYGAFHINCWKLLNKE